MTRRIRIHLSVGDILETVGAGLACYAVDRLAGLAWCLLLASLLLIVAGNLIYGRSRLTIPLPARRDAARLRHRLTAPVRAARWRAEAARLRRHA